MSQRFETPPHRYVANESTIWTPDEMAWRAEIRSSCEAESAPELFAVLTTPGSAEQQVFLGAAIRTSCELRLGVPKDTLKIMKAAEPIFECVSTGGVARWTFAFSHPWRGFAARVLRRVGQGCAEEIFLLGEVNQVGYVVRAKLRPWREPAMLASLVAQEIYWTYALVGLERAKIEALEIGQCLAPLGEPPIARVRSSRL